ncbi:MAG: Lrp/AsnC family transcriptional regulator [Lachnospirales bacterium]
METILRILEKNSRLSLEEIADMANMSIEDASSKLQALIDNKTICGFNTLINWEKTEREFITALIEVCVSTQSGKGYDKIAKKIYSFEEVKSVYLMSGVFDLTVIVEGKSLKDVSFFVSNKLSALDEVTKVSTHFVLKKYKDHGKVFADDGEEDERMIISP